MKRCLSWIVGRFSKHYQTLWLVGVLENRNSRPFIWSFWSFSAQKFINLTHSLVSSVYIRASSANQRTDNPPYRVWVRSKNHLTKQLSSALKTWYVVAASIDTPVHILSCKADLTAYLYIFFADYVKSKWDQWLAKRHTNGASILICLSRKQ